MCVCAHVCVFVWVCVCREAVTQGSETGRKDRILNIHVEGEGKRIRVLPFQMLLYRIFFIELFKSQTRYLILQFIVSTLRRFCLRIKMIKNKRKFVCMCLNMYQ